MASPVPHNNNSSSGGGGAVDAPPTVPVALAETFASVQARFSLGTRVLHAEGGHRGTVRFVGALPRASFGAATTTPETAHVVITIGVEWDDPKGVHDGTFAPRGQHRPQRFFVCQPKHGSYLAPAKVYPASSLEEVLVERYDAATFGGAHVDKLGRCKDPSARDPATGAFSNVWNVDCQASVATQRVARCGDGLARTFPHIKQLTLKLALLEDWHEVAKIAEALPLLETLHVGHNNLGVIDPPHAEALRRATKNGSQHEQLRVLNVSGCGVATPCVRVLLETFPSVSELLLGGNPIAPADHPEDRVWTPLSDAEDSGYGIPASVTVEKCGFRSIAEIADTLGPVWASRATRINANETKVNELRGLDRLKGLEALSLRECEAREWDDLLALHDEGPKTLKELNFSSPHLDGQLDTGDARRRHIVALLPDTTTHLNHSFIRDSERATARQALMTQYVALEKRQADTEPSEDDGAAAAAPAPVVRVPTLVRRMIDAQQAEGVNVFVPKPRRLELELELHLHVVVFTSDAAYQTHANDYFTQLVRGAAPAAMAEAKKNLIVDAGLTNLPRVSFDASEFVTPVRQTVESLRHAILEFLLSPDDPRRRLRGVETLAAGLPGYTPEALVSSFQRFAPRAPLSHLPAVAAAVPADEHPLHHGLVLHLLDVELMENPGAVARGFHCKRLEPNAAPIHSWRLTSGDHVVASYVLPPTPRVM